MAGIVGYGAYIPRKRIRSEEIARQWGKDPAAIRRGLLLEQKSVPGLDEDTITISVAAGRAALDRAGVDPAKIGAVYIGSESAPPPAAGGPRPPAAAEAPASAPGGRGTALGSAGAAARGGRGGPGASPA